MIPFTGSVQNREIYRDKKKYIRDYQGEEGGEGLPANAGDANDVGLITELGRSPAKGKGHPLQFSCLENSLDRERNLMD